MRQSYVSHSDIWCTVGYSSGTCSHPIMTCLRMKPLRNVCNGDLPEVLHYYVFPNGGLKYKTNEDNYSATEKETYAKGKMLNVIILH